MNAPDFFFIDNKEALPGTGGILSTKPPYNIGRVFKFDNNDSFDAFVKKYNLLNQCAVIEGYNMLIVWIGTINEFHGNPQSNLTVTTAVLEELNQMADLYYRERVVTNERYYKKHIRS